MYKSFFNLTRSPFELTPDPACFVATRWHNEALATLYYGVRWHKGFVVVTGEVGTGKTMLLRCLLSLLKGSRDIEYAYVFNGRLSATEFLEYVLADLGIPAAGKNKGQMLFEFGKYLVGRGENKQTTVIIVDEAHSLSDDLLEEIRLLSNLETADTKLLQILLVGQPELDTKLNSPHLRQLKQRIALRARLRELDLGETGDYISKRLQVAGVPEKSDPIFPAETVLAIHRHSRGLPRLVNTICENALIAAYAQQVHQISPEIVDKVAVDFGLNAVYPVVMPSKQSRQNEVQGQPEATEDDELSEDEFGVSQKASSEGHSAATAFAATGSE
jgi:general secretion pathway protein A